jgi:hypothetical protein
VMVKMALIAKIAPLPRPFFLCRPRASRALAVLPRASARTRRAFSRATTRGDLLQDMVDCDSVHRRAGSSLTPRSFTVMFEVGGANAARPEGGLAELQGWLGQCPTLRRPDA